MKKGILLGFLFSIGMMVFGQSPVGTWKTIDDETGEAKSYVEIYEKNGKLEGKITKLLRKPQDYKCEKCKGKRKGKKLVGMVIMWDMKKKGKEWKGGRVYKADSGDEYGCKIWLDGNDKLAVRGYHWTGIYKTQYWERVK